MSPLVVNTALPFLLKVSNSTALGDCWSTYWPLEPFIVPTSPDVSPDISPLRRVSVDPIGRVPARTLLVVTNSWYLKKSTVRRDKWLVVTMYVFEH